MIVVPREEHVTRVSIVASRKTVVVALCFAVVGVCIVSVLTVFLGFGAHHGFARTVARIVPVPAAVVDGRVVWYHEVVERANALEIISGVPQTESMDRALLLAERYAMVRILAERFAVEEILPGDEIIEANMDLRALVDDAHWTSKDRWRYAVEPYMLAMVVERQALSDAELQATARARLESIELKYQQGIGFADLAGEYGEGDAVLTAGDIGYVTPESLPEELRTVAKSIAIDEVSAITQTQYAFWLVKAEDVIENEDGTRSVWLRVIEVKKDLLGDIVDEQLQRARIREFLQ